MSKSFKKYACIGLCVSICILGLALFGFYIGAGRYLAVPFFQVLDFQLAGLDESLASSKVNTESTFTMETRNQGKKMHLYYDDFYFSVHWKQVNMGHGKAAGFDQGTKNSTYIHGSFRSSPANIELGASEGAELADARNSGLLTLSIDVDVRTQWKDISGLKSDKFDARIECKCLPSMERLLKRVRVLGTISKLR
ncbi:hypothetical protein AXG93_3911s1750 [Marchantia polymorpha subsp. ruderalis]|uniref:Uncharacterized protein n=1 Tax=Marchantia polymorpha subsp. ruderalis TaxID=1480154 RepID=A0A176W4M8_MARPO|nr:hypothetical protein AXG93_3911s1750 [Marchantia polymorpha subsp. ruderalis]